MSFGVAVTARLQLRHSFRYGSIAAPLQLRCTSVTAPLQIPFQLRHSSVAAPLQHRYSSVAPALQLLYRYSSITGPLQVRYSVAEGCLLECFSFAACIRCVSNRPRFLMSADATVVVCKCM